ncbi:MAG: hypothetical protein EHM49_10120 [Deltaproteobacteria bacterium]|nr:MAG: hypothetical protein EHM49_10120 [Deltaproteobacteria bacterium]
MMEPGQRETDWVIDWIYRMSKAYGGIVHSKEGKTYDWGQALCRECYGSDWIKLVGENPTPSDVIRAQEWEAGNWPEWVRS